MGMKNLLLFSILSILTLSVYSQEKRNPVLLAPESGDSLDLGIGTAIIKIYGTSTNNAYSQLELIEFPGYSTPLHLHPLSDEVFYIIEGTLTVYINGETQELQKGSILVIPKGTPHAQGNFTDRKVRVLITLSPSGFENFFVERAAIVKKHPPGTEEYGMKMMKLGETHDIKVLGPSPFEEE
ncbi:cupin [Flammeovirgaceae bacterium 311]|nr:cupin [Flammeovirgaceae bacterium 311]